MIFRMEFINRPGKRPPWMSSARFYDAFRRAKIPTWLTPSMVLAACKAGQLVLTSASRNGEALVWHRLPHDRKSRVVQYNGLCFRTRTTTTRALSGRPIAAALERNVEFKRWE